MKIITLDSSDDIVSICDRLVWADKSRVLFELRGDVPLQRLDLVRLRRFAERERIQVGLVTADNKITRRAKAIGLPTFQSVEAAKRDSRQWWRERRQRERVGFTALPREDVGGASPSLTTNKTKSPLEKPVVRFGIILAIFVLIGLFYATFITTVPRATVRLTPETRPLQATQLIDPNGDLTTQTNQLFQELSSHIPEDFTLVADSLAVVQEGDRLIGSGVAVANLDLETVTEKIAGQEMETAVAHLYQELPLQAVPTIEIWPVWFKRIPYRPDRIQTKIIIRS